MDHNKTKKEQKNKITRRNIPEEDKVEVTDHEMEAGIDKMFEVLTDCMTRENCDACEYINRCQQRQSAQIYIVLRMVTDLRNKNQREKIYRESRDDLYKKIMYGDLRKDNLEEEEEEEEEECKLTPIPTGPPALNTEVKKITKEDLEKYFI